MGTSPGPVFSGNCCGSFGTDLLVLTVMPTQWGRQVLDLRTHWTVPGPTDVFLHVFLYQLLLAVSKLAQHKDRGI